MKIEEIVILGLTGAAAYLVWRMQSQKPAMVTQSSTAPVARSPVSTAVVPVGSQQPSLPTMQAPRFPEHEWDPSAPRGSFLNPIPEGSEPSLQGRWLDQTTYRLEMPPTRDIMPQFLWNPPECKRPTVASLPEQEAYRKCRSAKSEECKAKGGYVVTSEFESMGPNSWGAKYGYCVDCEPPKIPNEVRQTLEARCPLPPNRCQGQVCPAIAILKVSQKVFGKDSGHRHGQYQIWKCV